MKTVQIRGGTEFDRGIHLFGTKGTEGTTYGATARTWFLASTVSKTDGVLRNHSIYFTDFYANNAWKFWQAADTEEAQPLAVRSISRDVKRCSANMGGCFYSETIAMTVSEDLLIRRERDGLRVRLTAKNGWTFVITISPDQITDQLAAARAHSQAEAPK